MYKAGEYTVHFTKGVCKIEKICTPDKEKGNDRRFYHMRTQGRYQADVYTPIDSDEVLMRPLMSRSEAESFICRIPSIASLKSETGKSIKEAYKKALFQPYPSNLVSIIKSVYERKSTRGKKQASFEREYSFIAKDILYTELAIALDISPDSVEDYIIEKIDG